MVVRGDNGKSVNKEWEKQLVPEAGYEIFFWKNATLENKRLCKSQRNMFVVRKNP